jgi:two-component system sensor histidine kinase HydH
MLRKAPSISHLLLAVFLLATLLPASVMTWMAFSEARDTLETEIGRDLQARAGSVVTEIDRMMFERLQNVASWSRLEIMQELRVGDIDKRLSRFLDETKASYSGVYLELQVVDAGQTIVASSEPRRLGEKFGRRRTVPASCSATTACERWRSPATACRWPHPFPT